jgi:peptidoglycan hydrolase-like protein with peptidoglycan-binding domain
MKTRNQWLSSLSLVMGALAFSTLPVWAQSGSPSERSGAGSSASQGLSGTSEGEKKGAPLRDERTQTGAMGQSGSSESQRPGSAAGNEDIKKVQQALKDKGQDPGEIDGVMGPKTKEALKAFQEKEGLKATGSLDNQTKKALGIEGSASSGRSSSAKSGKMGTGTGPSTDGRDSVTGGEGGKQQ